MSNSRPWWRRCFRRIAFLCAVVVLLPCSAVVVYDLVIQWQARSLIRVLKTIQVGRTSGRDAVAIANRFRGFAYTNEITELKNGSIDSVHDIPLNACVAGDCTLSVYPGLLDLKFLRKLWSHPGLFRRVAWNDMQGCLEIKQGVVQKLRVEMDSLDFEIWHSAWTEIYGEDSHVEIWNRTPWSIRKVQGVVSGGPPHRTSRIVVGAWSTAPQDRILRAFDFDTRCLWLGANCTRCQILPSACEDYDHDNSYEFIMPEEALAKFRQVVNHLKLGTPRVAIENQLGEEVVFDPRRRLRDLVRNRLPFSFPRGTVLTGPTCCPLSLTYYVKKWRLDYGMPEGPDDRNVTFVLDENQRLLRIESRVEGIASRP